MSSERAFVDTNVFAYALDDADEAKQARARLVIAELGREIVVSTQVLIELYAVCTRKLNMSSNAAADAVALISRYPVIHTDRDLAMAAVRRASDGSISVFGAAIVEAAAVAGCRRLITEDLNHGQLIAGVRVEDPFRG